MKKRVTFAPSVIDKESTKTSSKGAPKRAPQPLQQPSIQQPIQPSLQVPASPSRPLLFLMGSPTQALKNRIFDAEFAEELINILLGEWEKLVLEDFISIMNRLSDIAFKAKSVKTARDNRYSSSQFELKTIHAAFQNSEFRKKIIDGFLGGLPSFNMRQLALSARALVTLGSFPLDLLQDIANAAIKINFKDFRPKDLVRLASAFENANQVNPKLLTALADIVLQTNFKGFTFSTLLNLMSTFIKINFRIPELSPVFMQKIHSMDLKALDTKTLPEFIWVLAALEVDNKPLLESLTNQALQLKIKVLPPHSVIKLTSGLGKLGIRDKILIEEIMIYLQTNSIEFSTSELIQIIASLSKLGYKNERLIEGVTHKILDEGLDSVDPQTYSTLAFCLANFNLPDNPLVKKLVDHLSKVKFNASFMPFIPKLLWSMAVLNVNHTKLFQTLLTCVNQHVSILENAAVPIKRSHTNQLYQFKTYCDIRSISLEWDKKLLQILDQQIMLTLDNLPTPSDPQTRVRNALTTLQANRREIQLTTECLGGFYFDSFLSVEQKRTQEKQMMVVEIIQETPSTGDRGQRCDSGEVILKKRLITAMGWEFMEIQSSSIQPLTDSELLSFLSQEIDSVLKPKTMMKSGL